MHEIEKKIKKLVGTGIVLDRAVVKSVDKAAMTCMVVQVSDDIEITNVKIKPVINGVNEALMGIVCFPAVGSYVIIGNIDNDDTDVAIISMTQIESVLLDFGNNFKLTIGKDGKPSLNADQITFNGGSNGGFPLLIPLTQIINTLQKQVNGLIDAFTTHTHTGVTTGAGVSGITLRAAPAKTKKFIARADIENKKIKQ